MDFFTRLLHPSVAVVHSSVGVFGTFRVNTLVLLAVLMIVGYCTSSIIDRQIEREMWKKDEAIRKAQELKFLGIFLIVFSIGSYAIGSFGSYAEVIALFNPLFGLFPYYMGYRLQMGVLEGKIR